MKLFYLHNASEDIKATFEKEAIKTSNKLNSLRSSRDWSREWYVVRTNTGTPIRSLEGQWNIFNGNIEENLYESSFYFPTYRRIEEDLSGLGYKHLDLEDASTKLIQFGMDDVKQNFRQIQEDIKDTVFNLFSQVIGEMLTQFIEGINVTDEIKASIKPDILDIILSRVGEQNISLTEQEKSRF